jgi:phage baseplate assembly protein W
MPMTDPMTTGDPDAVARAAAASDYADALAGLLQPDWPDGHAPSDPYGIALTLSNGDLALARGVDGWRDLVTVAGTDELAQGLQVLIGTPLGTDIFNQSLGLDLIQTLAQPKALPQIRELIRLCVVKALAQEPRIRQIQALAFADEPAYLTIHPELTPDAQAGLAREQVSTRRWKLDALLDTRLGDQVTAGIQGVGP